MTFHTSRNVAIEQLFGFVWLGGHGKAQELLEHCPLFQIPNGHGAVEAAGGEAMRRFIAGERHD